MVAQKLNNQTQQDGDTNRITGTSLQYHSISTLIKALKHKTSLHELHYKISTNYYPPPTKTEISPTTIPMLFQSSHHPFTAFDDINSLSPQEVEYIMTTYCERFYLQSTKAMIKELKNSPDEEIKQMMQTPQTIQATITKNGHKIDFNPIFVSILGTTQHNVNKQQQPQPNKLQNQDDPFQILHLKAKTFKAKTTKEKIQTVLSNIQPLL